MQVTDPISHRCSVCTYLSNPLGYPKAVSWDQFSFLYVTDLLGYQLASEINNYFSDTAISNDTVICYSPKNLIELENRFHDKSEDNPQKNPVSYDIGKTY